MDRDPFDLTGDVLDGQFRVDSFAGEGDLSVVYKGHHLGVDAPVAIKCLNLPATLDPDLVRPLVDGFKEASRVHYKLARGNLNIAQSIASGTTLVPRSGGVVPYMVREWFEGESLASNLRRRHGEGCKGRSVQEALALLETAFDGVAFAHQQGEVHLSINPSNLFLSTRGDSATLKVLDFGIARTMNLMTEAPSGPHPEGGLRVLFPSYAAPEQLDRSVGKQGPWTDVYALALVTMEVLSDRIVMGEQESGAIVEHALDPKRRPNPRAHGLKLSATLDLVLTRAVTLAPARRQETAAVLWRDIKSAVRPTTSRSIPAVGMPSHPPKAETPVEAPRPVPLPVTESALAGVMVRPKTLMGMGIAVAAPFEPPSSPPEIDFEDAVVLMPSPPLPPLAPALVPTPSSTDDAPLFEPRDFMAPVWALIGSLVRRAMLLRDEPRGRVLMVVGSLVGAVFLVAVVASLWRHCGAPGPVPIPVASVSLPAPLPPPAEPEPPPPTPSPAPTRPFNAYAARRALDGTSGNVLSCRRDKKWGVALATVTFANDGSVGQVVVGVPFRGTPTGQCVAEDLSAARIPPFAGKGGVIVYQFFVALK